MKANTKKYLIIGGSVIGAGVLLYLIFKPKKARANGQEMVINSTDGKLVPLSSICKPANQAFPLKNIYPTPIGIVYCVSEKVKLLQKGLNSKLPTPYAKLKVDGKFGSKTESALMTVSGVKQVNQSLYNQLTMGLY